MGFLRFCLARGGGSKTVSRCLRDGAEMAPRRQGSFRSRPPSSLPSATQVCCRRPRNHKDNGQKKENKENNDDKDSHDNNTEKNDLKRSSKGHSGSRSKADTNVYMEMCLHF